MQRSSSLPPVITVDGPSGSGKGTVSRILASKLQWSYLDSGAIYRALAWAVLQKGLDADDVKIIADLAQALPLVFPTDSGSTKLLLDGVDITRAIRAESVSQMASVISVHEPVRAALLARQQDFRRWPGLVADGRDMGTVVFPDALYKIFLTATPLVRAKRRCMQLGLGEDTESYQKILADMVQRDQRDSERATSPLQPAPGALLMDTSELGPNEVIQHLCEHIKELRA